MLTFEDRFHVGFPNLTVKTLFTEYFNEVEHLNVLTGYDGMFEQFLRDHDLEVLFGGYWEHYIGQFPAQSFDKVNENFIRSTFYELCTRFLSPDLVFAIEVNRPTGRSDWEAIGRPHTQFEDRPEDIAQVTGYADDVKRRHPQLTVRRHVVYTVSCEGHSFFPLD